MSDGGKGDTYRKVDPDKFSEGYDRIWGKRHGPIDPEDKFTPLSISEFEKAVAKHGTHPGKVWNVNEDGEVVPADATAKIGTALAMQGFVGSVHEAYMHGVRVATEVHLSKTCGNCKHWGRMRPEDIAECDNRAVRSLIDTDEGFSFDTPEDFGCRMWEGK